MAGMDDTGRLSLISSITRLFKEYSVVLTAVDQLHGLFNKSGHGVKNWVVTASSRIWSDFQQGPQGSQVQHLDRLLTACSLGILIVMSFGKGFEGERGCYYQRLEILHTTRWYVFFSASWFREVTISRINDLAKSLLTLFG